MLVSRECALLECHNPFTLLLLVADMQSVLYPDLTPCKPHMPDRTTEATSQWSHQGAAVLRAYVHRRGPYLLPVDML